MVTIDEAYAKFELYKTNYEEYKVKDQDLSESDTRSKLIDFLFIDVLGWSERDIKREGHVDCGFYDYHFKIAGISFVVEAKRELNDFVLPNTKSRRIQAGTLQKGNEEVINQIQAYLMDLGDDTGIITNGRQFIIGKFISINGNPWKNNKCLIFKSIEDIDKNFVEFWNTLSKESVIKNKGIQEFAIAEDKFSKTLISSIEEKDSEITRNDLSVSLVKIIDSVFGDIFSLSKDEDNLDFIKACYVENKEVIKNKAELHGIFSDDPPKYSEVIKVSNYPHVKQQITDEVKNYPAQKLQSPTPKPIIIIGSRGAGKTTFIHSLFLNNQSDTNLSSFPFVYVNLMKYYSPTNALDFEKISQDIIENINESYPNLDIFSNKVLKQIYLKEINNKNKGVWANIKENDPTEYEKRLSSFFDEKINKNKEHLEKINLYLTREIHKRLILVFDNADQLSDDIQSSVFLFAASLNKNAKYGVIISLREGYYYQWRNKAPFDAFESNVYHIAAPDYGQVIQKRINYAIDNVSIDNTAKGSLGDFHYEVSSTRIIDFFNSIQKSLFHKQNTPILDFLSETTFPNIREGLRVFKCFLMSGYTEVEQYILRAEDKNHVSQNPIPIHEFIQSVGLENRMYYDHGCSNIPNLFYPKSSGSDHFLKIYILKCLAEKIDKDGRNNKYVSVNSILSEFQDYGYSELDISTEIIGMVEKNLIDTEGSISDTSWDSMVSTDINICITLKGAYYLYKGITRFHYFDLVIQDTPITDNTVYNNMRSIFPIRDVEGKRDMKNRILSVMMFVRYLEVKIDMLPNSLTQKYGNIVSDIRIQGLDSDLYRICNRSMYTALYDRYLKGEPLNISSQPKTE